MGKTLVSMRLDDELLEWSAAYAKGRGSNRTVVVEEALRHLRGLSEGGVPDLPASAPSAVSSGVQVVVSPPEQSSWNDPAQAAGRAEYARNISVRQRALNAAKERASK